MSPYEIMIPGGGNEHYNEEAGHVWLERVTNKWSSHLWINPTPKKYWSYSHTTQIIKQIFDNKMVPLTIEGLVEGTKILSKLKSSYLSFIFPNKYLNVFLILR